MMRAGCIYSVAALVAAIVLLALPVGTSRAEPLGASPSGRWIDATLTEPARITAYEGDQAVHSALVIIGTRARPTPTGHYRILRRVADETMDSATIGIPRNAPGGYYLRHVLYTQYFTNDGASLHYNYWSSNFGHPGSHGCLGLSLDDARWFWNWADVGTPIYMHY